MDIYCLKSHDISIKTLHKLMISGKAWRENCRTPVFCQQKKYFFSIITSFKEHKRRKGYRAVTGNSYLTISRAFKGLLCCYPACAADPPCTGPEILFRVRMKTHRPLYSQPLPFPPKRKTSGSSSRTRRPVMGTALKFLFPLKEQPHP